MSKATIQLETVTCPSCIKKIEGTLEKTEGVTNPRVLFNSSKVKTEYDETKITPEQIAETIQKLGYQVISYK